MCSIRLTEVDSLLRPDHYYISEDDRVYFFREFISHGGYSASQTNQLIANLKIEPTQSRRLLYKRQAIDQCARELTSLFPAKFLSGCTWVPVPPSLVKTEPEYDDRLLKILGKFHKGNPEKDVRELVFQTQSTRKSHCSESNRMKIQELLDVYSVDRTGILKARQNIVIFDDVLTAGAHFCAVKKALLDVRPDLTIVGIVIARVIRPDSKMQSAASAFGGS